MTLNSLNANTATVGINDNKRVTMLGSMLFLRCVFGSRVVSTIEQKEVSGYKFEGKNLVVSWTSQSKFTLFYFCIQLLYTNDREDNEILMKNLFSGG